jgi:hypothetical protein
MSFTHTITTGWGNGGAAAITQAVSKTAGQEINIDETIADTTTDGLVALAIDVSQLESAFILSDQDLTLETNSGSAADATISLKANEPLIWRKATYFVNPFGSTDVTALYVTNASGSSASLRARLLIDPTV